MNKGEIHILRVFIVHYETEFGIEWSVNMSKVYILRLFSRFVLITVQNTLY